jgi:hypothetical protein
MLKCCLCGADLGKHDGYVRGSISGEVVQPGPKATGQTFQHSGLAFCMQHMEDIPKNISENLSLIAQKQREKK